MLQKPSIALCSSPNKINLSDNLNWFKSVSLDQHGFTNFSDLSLLLFKKGGYTPMLDNHRKGIFPLKSPFLGECQLA